MGEVNHTTECVTDLFSFVDFELIILLPNSNYLVLVILRIRLHGEDLKLEKSHY